MAKQLPDTRRARAAAPADDLVYGSSTEQMIRTTSTEHTVSVARIPFTNNMEPGLYARWVRHAHHEHEQLQVILEAALNAYLADKPSADQPMTAKAEAKLQQKLSKTKKS